MSNFDNKPIKVMVVDDSTVMRTMLRNTLQEDTDIEVVAQAVNGKLALPRVSYYAPEIMILDNEMPEMTGLELLEILRKENPEVGVIMFSSHTVEGAKVTIEALNLGALDFVTKPGADDGDPKDYIKRKLVTMIKSIVRDRRKHAEPVPTPAPKIVQKPVVVSPPIGRGMVDAVAIGISTGGPAALRELSKMIKNRLHGSIFIVQHMPPIFTKQMANSLNEDSPMDVVEGADGMTVQGGYAYIAPGGKHMIVEQKEGVPRIKILDTEPELNCKPSVNVLFRSVAAVYGKRAAAFIMTGMGNDGYEGIKVMKQTGSPLFAQTEDSCLVYGMPAGPTKDGLVDESLDIQGIAVKIQTLLGKD